MGVLNEIILVLATSCCVARVYGQQPPEDIRVPGIDSVEHLPRSVFTQSAAQAMDPAAAAISELEKVLPAVVVAVLQGSSSGLYNGLASVLAPFDAAEEAADAAEAAAAEKESTFDFIVVGGGSAGAVVANRLSKYFNVLLLERGGEQQPLTYIPVAAAFNVGHPEIDYYYKLVPQRSSCKAYVNKTMHWSKGRGLGGSSNLNFMIYLRGHVKDYDNWANITGDSRWNYESIRKYLLSTSETGAPGSDFNSKDQDGVIHVENSTFNPLAKEFLQGAEWSGIKLLDVNEPYEESGAQLTPFTAVRGRRCSTYKGFIEPVRSRANLTILKHAQVYKILFKGKHNHAYGVEYERHGSKYKAFANKEVILSAGSIESPKILMLSGIGPKERLDPIGVKTLVDLPVGKNLHDHVAALTTPFIVEEPLSLLPERDLQPPDIAEFLVNGTGKLTTTQVNALLFFTSQRAIEDGEGSWPDTQYMFVGTGVSSILSATYSGAWNFDEKVLTEYFSGAIGKDAFQIYVMLNRPKQRGELWLRSADYKDDPVIDPKYFEDSSTGDMRVVIEGIKRALNICDNSPIMKKLGCHLYEKPFPGCESVPFRSDEYWDCYTRHTTVTIWHYVGTTAMGKRDSGKAVVDSELKVFGTKRLRVIDAGVMPAIVASNPNAATIMIAERGSYLILKKYLKRNHSSVRGN